MAGKRYAWILLILSLSGGFYAIIWGKIQNRVLKDSPVKYVYDPYDTVTSYVFYIRDLSYKRQYLKFVKDDPLQKEKIDIDFPFHNFLARRDKIYIRGYSSDSSLIKFYNVEHNDKFFGFTTGYIHKSFVHGTTANDNVK
jgi:hypothetical protein